MPHASSGSSPAQPRSCSRSGTRTSGWSRRAASRQRSKKRLSLRCLRGVFVTGTGTEVGKTVIAAAIAHTLAAAGESVAVFKPAVTGLSEPGEPDHELLRRASGSSQSDAEVAPYRYEPPASPHLAAELAEERIEPPRLLRAAQRAA